MVSRVLDWKREKRVSALISCIPDSYLGNEMEGRKTYLAIFQLEDKFDLVALNNLIHNLRGNPALGGVWLPRPGADIENVCHGEGEGLRRGGERA